MKRSVLGVAMVFAAGCASPYLTRDGQLVFQQHGARGASVLTAHGVEFLDATDVPPKIERHSIDEPWRAPVGFLLPKSGVWTAKSKPVAVSGPGLAVVVRTSDVLVPAWGGEVLLRIDALAPAAAFPEAAKSVRPPLRLAIVLDGHGLNARELAKVAIEDLGERDRAAVLDATRARTLLPLVPGSDQTLVRAVVERVMAERSRGATRELTATLARARAMLGDDTNVERKILVLSDGVGIAQAGPGLAREARATRDAGVKLAAIGAPDRVKVEDLAPLGPDVAAGGPWEDREDAVARVVPPPGDVVLEDVHLTFDSVPAPARVLEVSGGDAVMNVDRDTIYLGDLYADEARTEMARVALPTFTPGGKLEVNVTARYRVPGAPVRHFATQTLFCSYSDDIERMADERAGDVIAYGSALAMVRRLDRAFLGSQVDKLGGLRPVVAEQARSLEALARADHDAALGAQAEVLRTLLGAIED